MTAVLPPEFFFRFSLPVGYRAGLPKKRGAMLKLPKTCQLPRIALDDDQPRFGDLRLAWNEQGLGVSVEVRGKSMPLSCSADDPTTSDGLQLWLDTRNTQSIHRASRYCHHFCFLPATAEDEETPVARELAIARARENRDLANSDDLRVTSKILADGYVLEAWIPANTLTGYDPESNPQMGFYYALTDAELGKECLTVGEEFPYDQDPSVWSSLELVS